MRRNDASKRAKSSVATSLPCLLLLRSPDDTSDGGEVDVEVLANLLIAVAAGCMRRDDRLVARRVPGGNAIKRWRWCSTLRPWHIDIVAGSSVTQTPRHKGIVAEKNLAGHL